MVDYGLKYRVALIPMGALISPEDIAQTILFLSGEQAKMIKEPMHDPIFLSGKLARHNLAEEFI